MAFLDTWVWCIVYSALWPWHHMPSAVWRIQDPSPEPPSPANHNGKHKPLTACVDSVKHLSHYRAIIVESAIDALVEWTTIVRGWIIVSVLPIWVSVLLENVESCAERPPHLLFRRTFPAISRLHMDLFGFCALAVWLELLFLWPGRMYFSSCCCAPC